MTVPKSGREKGTESPESEGCPLSFELDGSKREPCQALSAIDLAGRISIQTTEVVMKQSVNQLVISSRGKGLYEFTPKLREWVASQEIQTGLLTAFCRHTSASLLIQEDADPTVRRDLLVYFDQLAPNNGPYEHNDEGLDDMPAHLKTALTQVQLSIPVVNGELVLGTWQGVYLFEHRLHPHRREIVLHLIGE